MALTTAEAVPEVAITRWQRLLPMRRNAVTSFSAMYSPMRWSLDRGGGIALEKDFGQADGAQRLGDGLAHPARFAEDDFGTAAADVDDQNILVRMRPAALHAKVDEPGLFLAGNDLDGRGDGLRCAGEELVLIAGVANGAGGDGADADDVQLSILLRHAPRERGIPEPWRRG